MFRKLAIVVITAVAALLETLADAITATLPPPAADSPRLRVVAPGRLFALSRHPDKTNLGYSAKRSGSAEARIMPGRRRVTGEGPHV